LKQIFVDNIFKDAPDGWSMLAAITGVHTVGNASQKHSGYDGHWSDPENQGKFNNNFYHSLLLAGWGPEKAVGKNPKKNQWKLVDLTAENKHKRFMLNTDICLAYTKSKVSDCKRRKGEYKKIA